MRRLSSQQETRFHKRNGLRAVAIFSGEFPQVEEERARFAHYALLDVEIG